MREPFRPAQPGDLCVLLEPSADEVPNLRQRQLALQASFGGRPHQVVHLTCQRCAIEDARSTDLIREVETLRTVPPVAIVAVSLIQFPHSFWGTRLLRWQIQVTDELHHMCTLVDSALTRAGATLHYAFSTSRKLKPVTALEDIPQADLEGYLATAEYPHHLFYARQVVLSRILGRGRFDILARIKLEPDDTTLGC